MTVLAQPLPSSALTSEATVPGVPTHVAIIMDCNRRWAKARGLPAIMGHRAGSEAVGRAVEACVALGVRHLTLYAFSSENWGRSEEEVTALNGLLRHYLRAELARLHSKGVRLSIIGEPARFGAETAAAVADAVARTAGNPGLHLTIALSYGSRAEIAAAARALAADAAAGRISADEIDEGAVASRLSTAGTPDPDLLIRTSGELRVSNFLLWQLAYAEFVFLEEAWPDFGEAQLRAAVAEFSRRQRRFGKG